MVFIILYRSDLVYRYTFIVQNLTNKSRIGINNLTNKDFVSYSNDFCLHYRLNLDFNTLEEFSIAVNTNSGLTNISMSVFSNLPQSSTSFKSGSTPSSNKSTVG